MRGDDTHGTRARRTGSSRALRAVGWAECLTLLVLVGNLLTVHASAISHVLGPLHGLAYTAAVLTSALVADGRHRLWLLALIPGVGGLLASRAGDA
ncbi:hypothetical protein UG55_105358 [Frankia sp. EI5c]|uniref:hypothetical protein n=1 Tax=Frankia sp. EI5c TaxID=683316 RepID=UPI0007C38E6E|nr:hypothetical protein [Frankia sp. EI5c]OAA21880.1 hypothetical protein UG55_105358 [Frankia sp. EI5c]